MLLLLSFGPYLHGKSFSSPSLSVCMYPLFWGGSLVDNIYRGLESCFCNQAEPGETQPSPLAPQPVRSPQFHAAWRFPAPSEPSSPRFVPLGSSELLGALQSRGRTLPGQRTLQGSEYVHHSTSILRPNWDICLECPQKLGQMWRSESQSHPPQTPRRDGELMAVFWNLNQQEGSQFSLIRLYIF